MRTGVLCALPGRGASGAADGSRQPLLVPPLSRGPICQLEGGVSGLMFPFQTGAPPLSSPERALLTGALSEALAEATGPGKLRDELDLLRKPPFEDF